MRSIPAEVGTYLFTTLAARDMEASLPFVRAVISQLLAPHDTDAVPPTAEQVRHLGDRVVTLVQAAAEAGAERAPSAQHEAAAVALAHDAPMLAAFFQNIDLLYEAECPDANAVSSTVMRALERLEASGVAQRD
jgi:hypothetical protein